MSSSSRRPVGHLLGIDDLDDAQVDAVFDAALDPAGLRRSGVVAGLVFASSSLRTRVGFATATARLDGTPVVVDARRVDDQMSSPESFEDTLRTVAGMVDVVVVRSPERLPRNLIREVMPVPFINAGDDDEHPTQALIDVHAMTTQVGPIGQLGIVLCGDLRMRAVRSLIRLLARRPPRSLVLIHPPGRGLSDKLLTAALRDRATTAPPGELGDADVLYLPGLPAGQGEERLEDAERAVYALTEATAARLPPHAVVLSPMPVIDEIAPAVRADPRVRMFQQSDMAVGVRMAVLDLLLGG